MSQQLEVLFLFYYFTVFKA